MKKIFTLLTALAVFASFSFSVRNDSDCKIMREGTFEYGNEGEKVKVVIRDNKHVEYHNNGKYYIKSDIKWLSDCEYNMTMTEVTIPDFPFGPGDVMNVKINKVKGSRIYYTSAVKGSSWEGVFTKVD